MVILPAIDIKDGNAVRLFKVGYATVEKVADNYLDTALLFSGDVYGAQFHPEKSG